MKNPESSKNILLATGLLGYLILFLLTVYHRQPPLFDEVLFIPNVYLFEKYGLTKEFILKIDNQAPGPLYQFIHYPLMPITRMETPGIRLVNVFILGLIILIVAKTIALIQKSAFKDGLILSLNLLAIPMIWQVAGMALTEVPTLLMASLSILFITHSVTKAEKPFRYHLVMAVLAGITMGLSILGRSPFLLVAFAAGILIYPDFRNPKRWLIVGITIFFALLLSVPVFWIWKGLMPPAQMHVGAGGIKVWHGILAFAYAALLTFIIAPHWFYFNKRIAIFLGISYVVFLVANVTFLDYQYAPLSEALEKILPASLMSLYPFVISPLLISLAVYFILCSMWNAWQKRSDPLFLFLLLSTMLILSTSFKVTHLFSSRYVAQAAPFLVILLISFDRADRFKLGRFIIGMVMGFLSLETYFLFK